ncbi:hypothetical protein IEQ11_07240 [Lysobacter capsici]|uniref:DUF7673 family protein n=1 Tax=Lysobacter capsici TaxID=435897 RepID=UPI00178266B4|nr:hypothetical protein [Lysobacter capsici]UOF16436.1 hypothetical protein IEQ11_07240 [Lysobacter capsici]
MKIASLIYLWNMTQQHRGTSGARVAAGVLLGIYNSNRFPFPLDELRALDSETLAHAIDVIRCDASHCQMEVHVWLNIASGRSDFGDRLEHLAHEYNVFKRGRCKASDLRLLDPARIVLCMAIGGDDGR